MYNKFILIVLVSALLGIFLFFYNAYLMKGLSCEGFNPHKMSCIVDYLDKVSKLNKQLGLI